MLDCSSWTYELHCWMAAAAVLPRPCHCCPRHFDASLTSRCVPATHGTARGQRAGCGRTMRQALMQPSDVARAGPSGSQVPGGSLNNLKLVETAGITRFAQALRSLSAAPLCEWLISSLACRDHYRAERQGVSKQLRLLLADVPGLGPLAAESTLALITPWHSRTRHRLQAVCCWLLAQRRLPE